MSDRYDVLLQTISQRNRQIRDLEAERDRLRAVVDADDLDQFIREQGPDFAALVKIRGLVAERDRLRAVVTTLNARYVDHMDECAVKVDYPCDCGLDDVLRQLDVSPTMGGDDG